jgi:hypothetical protein
MPKKFLVNATTGQLDIVSQIALAPVGTNPNPNGATLTANQVFNLELADASNPGLIISSQFNALSAGNPNQMVAYNSVGVLGGFNGYYVDTLTGGINGYINYDPLALGNYSRLNSFNSQITPSIDSPADSVISLQLNTDLDPGNTGIGFGTNGLAYRGLDLYSSSRSIAAFGQVNGINLSLDMGDPVITGGSIKGLSGINTGLSVNQGYTVDGGGGVRGLDINTNLSLGSTVINGFTGVNVNLNARGDMVNSANFFQATGDFDPTSFTMGGLSHYGVFTQLYGTVDNVQAFSSNPSMHSTSAINNYTGFGDNPNFQLGSIINNYNGVNVSPGLNDAIITGSFTGVNINMTNITPANSNQVTGLQINTNNGNLPSGFPSTAINSGGLHNFYANFEPPSGYSGFIQLNTLGGNLHVLPGQPLNNSFGFMNNLAGTIEFEDDIGPDPSGFDLGISTVGFVGQVAGALGKTMDTINYCVGGASVPADGSIGIPGFVGGGTVTNINLFSGLGILPAGGSLNITNLKGFRIGPLFTSLSPTNAWGISVEDPNAENYLAKSLAIGTTTAKVSAPSIGLEILTKDVLIDGGTLTSSEIIDTGLTADTAVYADVNKQLTSSTTTGTELGYLSGATSNIQAQIDALSSSGDIPETTFNSADNQATPVDVVGLAFANGVVRSTKVLLSVAVDATSPLFEAFELQVIQRTADWMISATSVGDNSGYDFSITPSGQVQYSNLAYPGFVSAPIHFRALTLSV